ncbi:MAG TPA: YbaN family protein [Bacteroidia bacterium]|nr:YbaN family protein [Bacteroidia bacterium]
MSIKRTTNIWLGHFFVAMGFTGLVLPLMPGTVFFIIAAWFYARSSQRFYDWLMNHRSIGVHIRNYREGKITMKGKIMSISSMGIAIGTSIWLTSPPLWVSFILVSCFTGVTLYLLSLKTV